MTDLATLELWRIFHDATQLAKLHDLQRQRCAERSITGGDRPDGLRLSTSDPVRRVKQCLDPFWRVHLHEGMCERGYLAEDLIEVALFHGDYEPLAGTAYRAQVPVRWHSDGITAHDFVSLNGPTPRVISCKSSINDTKPSAANLDQERRMIALGGHESVCGEFDVWMVHPGTLEATGPHTHPVTFQHIEDAYAELRGVSAAYDHFRTMPEPSKAEGWNSPAFWLKQFGLTSTSGAFQYERLDASGAIEARNWAFVNARAKAKEAKAAEDAAKALIRPHVEEQLALTGGKSVTAWGADTIVTYTIDARGAMRVTEKAHDVEAVAS